MSISFKVRRQASTASKTRVISTARSAAVTVGLEITIALAATPAAAASNAVEQLRERIEQLEARVDRLAKQKDQNQKQASANSQDSGSTLKLGSTKIEVGGYIKLDVFYDMGAAQGAVLLPTDVDVTGPSEEDGHLGWTAKETRLSISTTTPTAIGKVHGYIEFDMYATGFKSTDEGGAPRLRLAYITYGHWLFGRAYTTFANDNYGKMLNFAGPTEQIFQRTEQIRYTFHLANGSKFAVALEDTAPAEISVPDPDYPDEAPLGITVPPGITGASEVVSSWPQLAMRYQASVGNLDFQVAGLARGIEAESKRGVEDSAFAWGVNVGGTLSLASGTKLMLSTAYGEGIGDIIYTANRGPAGYFVSGTLKTNKRYGAIGTISQKWSDAITTNLIYAHSVWQAGATNKEVHGTSFTVNLLYTPVKTLLFGIEYDRVTKEVQLSAASNEGEANRIQFSAVYYF